MKNNKVKFFLLTCSTLVIIIASIFLFRKVSYGNLSSGNDHDYWDGVTVSSSLSGSGTRSDPYLISNGADFAKFVAMSNSSSTKYYYQLTTDIYLNKGYFFYNKESDHLIYYLENREYYILGNGADYYTTPIFYEFVGSINSVNTINSFKGVLDGNSHSIIGLYVYDSNAGFNPSSLFNEIANGGSIKNINFLNSLIMGKGDVGLVNNLKRGTIQNIIYNGIIYNSLVSVTNYNNINGQATYSNNIISLSIAPETDQSIYYKTTVTGTSNVSFQYKNHGYSAGNFTIELESTTDSLELTPTSGTLNITNLSYTGMAVKRTNCGLISNYYTENSNIVKNISIHGTIAGWGNTGAIIGKAHGNSTNISKTIQHCYNNADVYSKYIAGGLIGYAEGCNKYSFNNLYNNAIVYGKITGGIIGTINYNYNNMSIQYKNIINISEKYILDGQIVGMIQKDNNTTYTNPTVSQVYYIHQGKSAIGASNLSSTELLNYSSMIYKSRAETLTTSNLNLMDYNTTNGYVITDGKIPYFTNDDVEAPNITISLNYKNYQWTNDDYYKNINKIIIPNNIQYPLTYTYTDDNEIGMFEAFFDDNGDIFDMDNLIEPYTEIGGNNTSENSFSIMPNTANILQVRIIDKYGNVGLARSDLIINDNYELTYSEGVNHNEMRLDANYTISSALNSEIQINNYLNHELDIEYFPYSSSARLYFCSNNALPDNTELYLFDYLNNNIYKLTITSQTTPIIIDNYYYYDLSLFTSIYDNGNYDSLLINNYNNSSIKYNFEIIIKYNIESGSNYFEKNTGQNISVIDNNQVYRGMDRSYYNIVSPENHNNYNLTTTTNGSLSLSTINSNMTINYNISNNINIVNNNSANYNIYIYDQINNYTQKYLKIEIIDSNNNKITNFVPFNIKYELDGTTYHSSNNGATYIPITSDTGTITATVLDNTNLDVKSGNYSLRITAYNKYNNDISGSTTIPITINNARPINNNSFQVEIDDGDKFINKNTGQTNSNDSNFNIHLKYIGTLNTPMVRFRINKFNESSNTYTLSNVNPNTIFNQSFSYAGVYNGENNYYLLTSYITSNQQYNFSIPIKTSSLPEGKYIISVTLFNGISVSEEQFNIIIK